MQEEIEHKTVNFAISTVKLSARTLLKGAQFFLRQYDKSASQGKQSMKRLIRQNRGVTNLEIEKTGIKDTTVTYALVNPKTKRFTSQTAKKTEYRKATHYDNDSYILEKAYYCFEHNLPSYKENA